MHAKGEAYLGKNRAALGKGEGMVDGGGEDGGVSEAKSLWY
jgi:hypothetical protein